MDYTTLVGAKTLAGSIKYLINYSEIDATGILQAAEDALYAQLRVREMRKISTMTVAEGDSNVALPSDWLSPLDLRLRYNHELRLNPIQNLGGKRLYDSSTTAMQIAVPFDVFLSQTDLEFAVKSDAAYTIDVTYYARPTALGAGNTTNFLTDNLSHLLRNQVLELAYQERKELDMARYHRQLLEVDLRKFEQMADTENDTIIYDHE